VHARLDADVACCG